jgi:hypothetical protein
MKRSLIALLAAAMFIISSAFITKDGDPPVKKESTKAKAAVCGMRFIAYNDRNMPVKTIQLRNIYTGYSVTVYNPTFPYDFGEWETGSHTFTVTFDQAFEGSLGITPDNIGGVMWCGSQIQATWQILWSSAICTTERIKIYPEYSCIE